MSESTTTKVDWINGSPVVELQSKDVAGAAKRLADSIAAYGATASAASNVPRLRKVQWLSPSAHARRRELRDVEKAWQDRGDTAMWVAHSMHNLPHGGYDKVYAYVLYGVEVAMMCMSASNGACKIEWLATHPGVAGGGEIMIETACSRSQRAFCGGVVTLSSLGEQATRFYRSVGFLDEGLSMKLEPGKLKSLWMLDGDEWRLRKHAGRTYAAMS